MKSHQDHQHRNGPTIGSGQLLLDNNEYTFIEGNLFLELSSEEEEQRVCLRLNETYSKAEQPFADLVLDKPLMVGNYPIKKWKVFLLSATYQGKYLDVLISPKVDKFDALLRPKF